MRVLVLAFCFSLSLFAQLDRGTLTGTITDPAGAVMPNAKITLIHQGTQATTASVGNESGQY